MAAGRLGGDAVVARIGDRAILILGTLPIVTGFLAVVAAPVALIAMAGFLLIGLGISNVVPVLCRRAGKQKIMPPAVAIAVVTTAGYAGILVGPAGIGLVAHMVQRQIYITGAIGSQGSGEAFSSDYDLPNDTAYAESCASIGLMMFARRMRLYGEQQQVCQADTFCRSPDIWRGKCRRSVQMAGSLTVKDALENDW